MPLDLPIVLVRFACCMQKLHKPFNIPVDLILMVLIQPDHLHTCGTGPERAQVRISRTADTIQNVVIKL